MLKLTYFPALKENKKGEGRFSFTFLRREISPATHLAAFAAVYIEICLYVIKKIPNAGVRTEKIMHKLSTKLNMQLIFFGY